MKYLTLCKTYQELETNPSRLKKIEILSDFIMDLKPYEKEIIYLLKGKVFPDYSESEFGISEKLVIKALIKSSGNSEKEIINNWKKLGDLGLVAEKIISSKKQNTLFSHKLTTEKVLNNLKKLPTLIGIGTIEHKLALISELLTSAQGIEAKYIVRTLLGDLRVGVAAGTLRDSIRDAFYKTDDSEKQKKTTEIFQSAIDKSNDFALVFEKAEKGLSHLEKIKLDPDKPVKVMLYQKENTIEEGFKRVGKPALLDYKYDGFRMMISKSNGKIKIFTRRLDNVTPQFPEVTEYINKYVKGDNFMIDSEAVGYDPKTKKYKPFQEISQRIKRKYEIEKLRTLLPVEVNVFDIIYYKGKSYIDTPLKDRRKLIEKIIPNKKYKIKPADAIITDDPIKAEKFYKKALSEGEEGVMMKNLDSPYKPGSRVGHGIKIKPQENEFDLVITGAEYGTGKRAGWLTSFDLSCRDDDKLLEIGKASTGLKEKSEIGLSYEDLTNTLKPLITKSQGRSITVKPKVVVTIVYQNIQKSTNYNSGFALRFPRITRQRPDRDKNDIATLQEITKDFKKQII